MIETGSPLTRQHWRAPLALLLSLATVAMVVKFRSPTVSAEQVLARIVALYPWVEAPLPPIDSSQLAREYANYYSEVSDQPRSGASWELQDSRSFVERKALELGEKWALSYFRGSYSSFPGWGEVEGRLVVTGFYFDSGRDWATLEMTVKGARHLDFVKLTYPREKGPLREWTVLGKEVEGADVALDHHPWLNDLARKLKKKIWLTEVIPHNLDSWREAGLPGRPGYSVSLIGSSVDSAILPLVPGPCLLGGGSDPFIAALDLQTRRPYGEELTVVHPDGKAAVVGQPFLLTP